MAKQKLPMASLGGMGGSVTGQGSALNDPAAGMMAPPASPMANFSPSSLVKPRPKGAGKKSSKGSSSKGTRSRPPMKGAAY